MIKISSGGMKAAAFGQKMDEIWMKAAAFGQKMDEWTKFGFSAELAWMQPYSRVELSTSTLQYARKQKDFHL